jgi:serine/threonine protein kinase
VADSGLVARKNSEDVDMDVVWRAISTKPNHPHSSGQANAHPESYLGSSNGVVSPVESDRYFNNPGEKFSGSYGSISEVDDLFASVHHDAPPLRGAVRRTPEEMRSLHLGHLYLVFDFVDTDLSKIIRSNQYMTKGHVQFILYQLLLGLKYMHSANVIHRDIKPANILVSCVDCSVKIADFGLARVVEVDAMARNQGNSLAPDGAAHPVDFESSNKGVTKDQDQSYSLGAMDTSGPMLDDSGHDSSGLEISQHSSAFDSQPFAGSGAIVTKVPLKRALTKHVVSPFTFAIHASYHPCDRISTSRAVMSCDIMLLSILEYDMI